MATESKPKIYEAISNVMKDVGAVGKNSTNDFDHYKFRGIDAVMNALNPAMVKNKVFVTPTVLDSSREERQSKNGQTMMYSVLTVKYTFYTDDGSSVECVVVGEAMDRSDKSSNKAMSAAFKYACFQTFCLPTEEMQDTEDESPDIGQPTQKKSSKSTSKKSDEQLDKEMKESVDKDLIPEQGQVITAEQLAKLNAELERTGVSVSQVLKLAKVDAVEKIQQTTFTAIMNKFAKTKSANE